MKESVRAIRCPSCGGPISLPEGGGRVFACQFCGTTLEDQTTPQERETGSYPRLVIQETIGVPTPPQPVQPISISPVSTRRVRRIGGLALLVGFIPAVIGIGVALVIVWIAIFGEPAFLSGLFKGTIYSYGSVHLVPGENDGLPDVYAVARYPEEVARMVYLDFDPQLDVRWTSDTLGDGADYVINASTTNQTHIFLAYETTLTAFDRADGNITWLTELSDQVSNICQDCLQVFGNRVVALTNDGRLSAFDTLTGETAWKVRLNTAPRWMKNLGGRVVVLDEGEDGVGINIYQPEHGERLQRIIPTCPNDIFPDIPQTIGIYDPVIVTLDGERLLIPIYLYKPGCIQTWEATGLSQVGQISVPTDILNGMQNEFLYTQDALYLSKEDQDGTVVISRVNLADGSFIALYGEPDYKLTPLDAQAGTLTLLAQRMRGTSRYELRGMVQGDDAAPWTYEFTAEEPLERIVTSVDDQGNWYVATAPGKVLVLEAYANPAYAALTILNPTDGTTLVSSSLQFDRDDSDYWLQVPGWDQDRLFLVTGNQIRMINTTTGNQEAAWP